VKRLTCKQRTLSQSSRAYAWLSALVASFIFCVLVAIGSALLRWLFSDYGGRSLTPVIASHTITDMIIEPWLVLAALSGELR
jgi:hypothetical protein